MLFFKIIYRWKNQLHGDLFLTRHLLILREQLIPFNMNLQSIEKQLDFSPTGNALTLIVNNSMSLLRFDSSNTIFQIARDGLPGKYFQFNLIILTFIIFLNEKTYYYKL